MCDFKMFSWVIERNHWPEMSLLIESLARYDIHENLSGTQPNLQALSIVIKSSYSYPVSSMASTIFIFFHSFQL